MGRPDPNATGEELSDEDLMATLKKPQWPQPEWDMPLRKPVPLLEGGEVASLSLREPTDAEWEEAQGKERGLARRFLISKVCGLPLQVVARIGIGDTIRAEEYLVSFFAFGQAIGVS